MTDRHADLTDAEPAADLARTTLQILFLGALIAGCLWILSPFLMAMAWATTIVVATWPLSLRMQAWLGGSRSLAVAVMTGSLLLVLVVPLTAALMSIVQNAEQIVGWSKSLATLSIPSAPPWIEGLPVIGARMAARWQKIATSGLADESAGLAPYIRTFVGWFVAQVGSIGMLLVHFLLTVIVAAILYAKGETAARGVQRFARRLAGSQGENAVHLAAQAVRAVALGVIVTAVLQSALGGIGLATAGVPFAAFLTAVMFVLGIAQVGPAPVLVPAVIWAYWTTGVGWGTALLVWSIGVGTLDNVVRPMLIRRGADLPLLLIFAGVIGGLIAFGVIGLFIGPVVLAVAYTLLVDWIAQGDRRPPETSDRVT